MKCPSCNSSNIMDIGAVSSPKLLMCEDCSGTWNAEKPAAAPAGQKYDTGKPRWSLVPWPAQSQVVDVLTYGAKKYGDHNWQQVPQAKDRYTSATIRHITAWLKGEKTDSETGLHHLAHAICCLLFLLDLELKKADTNEQ